MGPETERWLADFYKRNSQLLPLREPIEQACRVLVESFAAGGKLLLCGNGGSCADCDHIAGELLKGFLRKRPLSKARQQRLRERYGSWGDCIAGMLQQGLPTISLTAHAAAISAFANDVDAGLVYAQQVNAFGQTGDVLLAISTSGNAANVTAAAAVAAAEGLRVIALTGGDGGRLARLADIALCAPEMETYLVQEQHIRIYHLLCAVTEMELFDRKTEAGL